MKIQFEAGSGINWDSVNYLRSEDGRIYAECPIIDGCSEDYGYFTLRKAILDEIDSEEEAHALEFQYDGQEEFLAKDASADCEVYVEIIKNKEEE